MNADRAPSLIARLTLVVILVPHALSKITGFSAFLEKFDFLTPALVVLIIIAELGGAIGLVLGAGLPDGLARWVSRASVLAIAAVQVGAAVVVHGGAWFYFLPGSGLEVNVMVLGLCLIVAVDPRGLLGQVRPRAARR